MMCSRATNEYGFQVELLNFGNPVIGYYLTTLFNRVVCTIFLEAWLRHVIHPIHKMGLIYDPKN